MIIFKLLMKTSCFGFKNALLSSAKVWLTMTDGSDPASSAGRKGKNGMMRVILDIIDA